MTQRERADDRVTNRVGMYDANPRTTANVYEGDVVQPTDQVRWGPIIAGLFTALTTLLGLSVLGLAIGLSIVDTNDPLRNLGIGAGIWGLLSALIAFGIGGYMAGGTAAFRDRNSGMLNGALVWIVALPLLLYLLGSGVGAILGTASAVAGTAAEVASGAAQNPAVQATAQAALPGAAEAAQATAQALPGQVTPQQVENAADAGGRTAWGTLLWLGLGAAAAIGGGYLGGQNSRRRVVNA